MCHAFFFKQSKGIWIHIQWEYNVIAIFDFAVFLNRNNSLKERICSSKSKFFPLRAYLFKKGFVSQRKKLKSQNFETMQKKKKDMFLYTLHMLKKSYKPSSDSP